MARRPLGCITVTLLGPMVQMEAGRWDELKAILKRLNFEITEESPSIDGRNVKRLYRTPPGPKRGVRK